MRFEILLVLGHDRRVEDDWEESSEELVVDLDPLAVDRSRVGCRGIDVTKLESSERDVDHLLDLLVENRDPDSLELDADRHVDRGIRGDSLESDRAIHRARARERSSTCWLERALTFNVVGDDEELSGTVGTNVEGDDLGRSIRLRGQERG